MYCTYKELFIVIDLLVIFEAFSVFQPSKVLLLILVGSSFTFLIFVDEVLHQHRKTF